MSKSNESPLFSSFSPVSDEEWKQQIIKELKGKSPEGLSWEFEAGMSIAPYYRASDRDTSKLQQSAFRRGNIFNQPGIPWQMIQKVSFKYDMMSQLVGHSTVVGH